MSPKVAPRHCSIIIPLGLIPGSGCVLQPGFHKLRTSSLLFHPCKLKIRVHSIHKITHTLTIVLPKEDFRRWQLYCIWDEAIGLFGINLFCEPANLSCELCYLGNKLLIGQSLRWLSAHYFYTLK